MLLISFRAAVTAFFGVVTDCCRGLTLSPCSCSCWIFLSWSDMVCWRSVMVSSFCWRLFWNSATSCCICCNSLSFLSNAWSLVAIACWFCWSCLSFACSFPCTCLLFSQMVFGVVHEAAYYRPEAAYPSCPPCFLTLQCVFAAHLLPVSYVEVADEPVGLECCPEPVVCSSVMRGFRQGYQLPGDCVVIMKWLQG